MNEKTLTDITDALELLSGNRAEIIRLVRVGWMHEKELEHISRLPKDLENRLVKERVEGSEYRFNRPFKMKEGQTYRATMNIECEPEILKGDHLYIEEIKDPHVTCIIKKPAESQDDTHTSFSSDVFEVWIEDKILVLEDEEIVVKSGHKYRVNRDIKANFTDDVRHKEGEILEVTQVDEAYVSYRVGEVNMRESADKFRRLISTGQLVLVGSEFKGEMPCEFKDGMKFKFTKEFARVCGVPGNDFYPGDTISIIPINRTDIAIINDRGYNTGKVKIEWLRERIEDGTLVPFVDDQTSDSDDDKALHDGDTGSGERTLSKGQVFECIQNCKNLANKILIHKGDRVTIDGTSDATYAVRIGDVATEIYKRPFNSWVDTKRLIPVNKPGDPLLGKRFKVAKNCKARNGVNDRVIFKKGDIIVISCESINLDGYYDIMVNYEKHNAITQDFIRRCIEEGKLEDCTSGSLPEGEKKFEVLSPCIGVNKFTIFDSGSILVVRKDGPDHYSVFETAHGWRAISKKFFDECVEDEKIREIKK